MKKKMIITLSICTFIQIAFLMYIEKNIPVRIAMIDLVIIVIMPLVIFFLGTKQNKLWILRFFTIILIWFFTLPFFHELSHVLGVYVIGSKPIAFQLIPNYLNGDFTTAWVRSEIINDWRSPIPGLFPYIKDAIFAVLGYAVFTRLKSKNDFLRGFIYMFFCIGSAFDITNNYIQNIMGYKNGNDFHGVSLGWGEVYSNMIGIILTIISITFSILAFKKDFQFMRDAPAEK